MVLGRLVDYHVHSTESSDGKSSIVDMCQKAVDLGMSEIGFSEHVDFDPSDSGYSFFNYERYSSEIDKARRIFEERLVIRKGVEVDYQERFEKNIRDWLRNKEFEFIIGAVHYVDGRIIDHNLVNNSDLRRLYHMYFEEITNSLESGLFDIVGHLDYIVKHRINPYHEDANYEYWKEIIKVLDVTKEKRKYLEINSKLFALKRKNPEMMPNKRVLHEFLRRGGNLFSIGSDAHYTTQLCSGIKEALDLLDELNSGNFKILFQQ